MTLEDALLLITAKQDEDNNPEIDENNDSTFSLKNLSSKRMSRQTSIKNKRLYNLRNNDYWHSRGLNVRKQHPAETGGKTVLEGYWSGRFGVSL